LKEEGGSCRTETEFVAKSQIDENFTKKNFEGIPEDWFKITLKYNPETHRNKKIF
jgi:hypothetical protein